MDFIFDIIFELILEGSFGAVEDRKVPMGLRVLAATVLILIFGGIIGGLIVSGIIEKNYVSIAIGTVIAIWIVAVVAGSIKKRRNGKNKTVSHDNDDLN